MPFYRFADFVFDLDPRYPQTVAKCRPYQTEAEKADFVIRISEEDIDTYYRNDPSFSRGYYEGLCTYRDICTCAAERGAVLLHAATVCVNGKAYAFCAPSGTGKSTHIRLWRKVYGDKVTVINGDKPLVRQKGEDIYAYGTPWCGKEGWHANTSAPLAAVCFIERAKENAIRPLSPAEATEKLFGQMLKPGAKTGVIGTLDMADRILRTLPVYLLSCNISEEAAVLSYQTLTGDRSPAKQKGETE